MRFIKRQLSLWRVVLIIGGSALAIPIAARVSPTAIAVHQERQDYLDQQTTADNEDADDTHSKDSKAAVGEGVALLQDLLYDKRSQYWDKRVLRRTEMTKIFRSIRIRRKSLKGGASTGVGGSTRTGKKWWRVSSWSRAALSFKHVVTDAHASFHP